MSTVVSTPAKCQPACLLRLIGKTAEARPDAVAVLTKNGRLTYRELMRAANWFAALLREAKVPPEAVVGVCMERSPLSVAALLGIWKIGAAYLTFDSRCPTERLAFMLKDADVRFVIATKKQAALLPEGGATHILFADDLPLVDERPDAPCSDLPVSADSLAYVLYTSGSTGNPKGVEVCHGGLENVVAAVAEELKLRPGEVLLAHSSVAFDVSNLETYLPLVSGGSLYIAENNGACDGARLINDLTQSRATTMLGTCAIWRLLIEAGWAGKPDLRVISGGEVLTAELASLLIDRSAEVWNQYGPTEATICSTTARIQVATDKVTIGRPISNVTAHVLDEMRQPITDETAGELFIGGVGVARGYRNRPALSAASFLPDPFDPESGGRLYKTGDLARRLADGRIEFLGRSDNQVKVHGHRIELEEIEEQIRRCPGVNAVVVLAVARGAGDQRLIAWIESKQIISPFEIRDFLKTRLPTYMVPSEFRHLDSLPLNQNGKVDRNLLRVKELPFPSGSRSPGPDGDVETRLKSIWENLLSIGPISREDSFFDAGGDSLLAAVLVTRIENSFGQRFSPEILAECPTVQSLADRLNAKEQNVEPQILVPLHKSGQQAPFFVVHGLGGSVFSFRALTMSLGDQRPVYAVSLPAGHVTKGEEIDIKLFAARCVREIRRLYPSGPYHLGGHSFGGLIAFEIASQLSEMGAPMGMLGLLDSDRTLVKSDIASHVSQTQGRAARFALRLQRYKSKLESLAEKGLIEVIRRRMVHIDLQRRVKIARRVYNGELPGRTFDAKELLALAGANYIPLRYPGNAVLIRAENEARSDPDGALGWADLVGGHLEVVDIPGKHLTILEAPHVSRLVAELTSRMNSVR